MTREHNANQMSVHNSSPEVSSLDELNRTITIKATLDSSGLDVAGESRALAAADRLLGGLVGIPAAYLEGLRRRVEIRNTYKNEALTAHLEQAILKEVQADDDRRNVAAQRLLSDATRKQENCEAIWIEASDSLKALPTQDQAATASEIDEDWLNLFTSYAEKASSDRLRKLWGRILAGEIRKPGAFAPSTLRVMSEMDPEIAQAFQKFVETRLSPDSCLRPANPENEKLVNLIFLQEVGLLQEVQGNLAIKYEVKDGGCAFVSRNYCLRVLEITDTGLIQIPILRITRIGQQLAEILPWDEVASLERLSETITGNYYIEIAKLLSRNADGYNTSLLKILREKTK